LQAQKKKTRMNKLKESVSGILSFHQKNKYKEEPTELVENEQEQHGRDDGTGKPKRKKKPWTLPHWCIYIAWIGQCTH
jgi:hypothetical protein